MQELEIRVGGCEIFGAPREGSANAFIVKPDGFQGWQGLPAGRRQALARAVEHGEHDVPVYLPSRVVTIDMWAIAESARELGHMSERLTGVGGPGERIPFSVTMYGEVRTAYGRRVLCEFDDSGHRSGGAHGEAQLQMVFADPRKYGDKNILPGDTLNPKDPAATATSIPVFHRGNFPAFPVIEVPSAPAAYSISARGKTFAVSGATAGGTHEVHLRSGRVYRNGVEMPGVGHGDLWVVPSGAALVHTLSVAGRVKITDTFI